MEIRPNLQVGYIVADRTKEDLLETAGQLELHTAHLPIRSLIDDFSIDMGVFETQPLSILFGLLDSMLPIDLVVVDPLLVFTGVDTNKYHLNAAKLIRINRWCMEHKVTLLGTHHATKARTDFSFKRAQDRISGSSALQGYTSTQLFLAGPEETDNEDGLTEWTIVSHHAPPRRLYFARTGPGFELVRTEETVPTVPLEVRITTELSQRPMKVGELIGRLKPTGRTTIYRGLERLEASGVVVKTHWGLYRLARAGDHPES